MPTSTQVSIEKPTTEPTSSRTNGKKIDLRIIAICILLIIVVVISIALNNNSNDNSPTKITGLIDVDNGESKINWDRYTTKDIELSESFTITDSGIYHLTGTLNDGMVTIDAGIKGEVKLTLDNVSITNAAGPTINCISGDDLAIELVGANRLQDGSNYDVALDEDIDGTIYSKADLTFTGEGSLDIIANYQDAIVGKDDVKFDSGAYTIVAADDGIRGKDSVHIVDGAFNITSQQDAIKSTNNTDQNKGFALIEGGNINISAGDDAIHGEHTLAIQSGLIRITKSYEGLESPKIIINGGDISIVSSDDGINAGSSSDEAYSTRNSQDVDTECEIIINDGDIYINSSGDGIDSNGWIYLYGGVVTIDGPTSNNNGALDSGAGITQYGGTIVAIGSSGMVNTPNDNSNIPNISIYFNSPIPVNTKLTIKDSADNTIIEHTSAKMFTNATIGSPNFSFGNTYSIYIDDQKYQDFTINDILTTIGNYRTNNTMPAKNHR